MPYWLGIREFHLNPQGMKVLRSRVAAVSTEVYWIALRTDGYEFDRIPGRISRSVRGRRRTAKFRSELRKELRLNPIVRVKAAPSRRMSQMQAF